ncbi:MAG: site-specific DNA-methyltransferase [Akkermansiaceae bacterium]|nr:site-specific DNA-methyltransferase [Akkermansiaceae bacterium]
MAAPKKPVKAYKHKDATRAHIPSGEEAGYEAGSDKVAGGPEQVRLPLNPVLTRGQDPELFWMHKYATDERLAGLLGELESAIKAGSHDEARLLLERTRETIQQRYTLRDDDSRAIDIRSLYRHEHVSPETLIRSLHRIVEAMPEAKDAGDAEQPDLFAPAELFGNAIAHEELDKVSDYYTHSDGWTNRLIQGDSHLVMTSLLEREGMAGQVQCIYIDPPYGIKYGSNWQMRLNNRTVTDGKDEDISGEPEQIKAFRDTWELGIHSYLGYLRDRLLVARALLHESGSCFVQISDENVHLVRCLMDEVFGSECFYAEFLVKKKGSQKAEYIEAVNDYVIWYGRSPKDSKLTKFKALFERVALDSETLTEYKYAELPDGTMFDVANAKSPDGDVFDYRLSPRRLFLDFPKVRIFRANPLTSGGVRKNQSLPFVFHGQTFNPGSGNCWKTTVQTDDGSKPGMTVLAEQKRLIAGDKQLRFKSYHDDFGYQRASNWWDGLGGASNPVYVVQTNVEIVKRCVLMTTDPGDLILDPTCGSGTTAYVAEQWGRRWITIDTSRIALNIAKTRLMTANFPYYELYDQDHCDLRLGFQYKKVPHITLGSIANNEPPAEETLYDQPKVDRKRLRVAGPFTVETLQSYEPVSPEELARQRESDSELANFEDLIFEHLRSAGVKTGDKRENAVFTRIDRLSHASLHAEGWYPAAEGEKKAYLHIGPKFGTVSKQAVTEAIKACRDRRDADWLLILGFAFESGLLETTKNFGSFQVSLVRMHDDLMQQGLLKKDKKAASFVTIGEPDIRLHRDEKAGTATVEIAGLDIYDPIQDVVNSRDVHDINYWMLDDDYDGSNFVVRQVFFCGGDKDEFKAWQKGLTKLAAAKTRKKAEQTLKIEIDEEAFESLYGHISRPFAIKPGGKVAVRVISQFGEETTKILELE